MYTVNVIKFNMFFQGCWKGTGNYPSYKLSVYAILIVLMITFDN